MFCGIQQWKFIHISRDWWWQTIQLCLPFPFLFTFLFHITFFSFQLGLPQNVTKPLKGVPVETSQAAPVKLTGDQGQANPEDKDMYSTRSSWGLELYSFHLEYGTSLLRVWLVENKSLEKPLKNWQGFAMNIKIVISFMNKEKKSLREGVSC